MPAKTASNICAACNYPHLRAPQRSSSGGASHEICPACGFEPGFTDDDQDITPTQWAKLWVKKGSPWFSKGISQPIDWLQSAKPTKPAKKAAVKKSAAKKAPAKKAPAKKAAKKATKK